MIRKDFVYVVALVPLTTATTTWSLQRRPNTILLMLLSTRTVTTRAPTTYKSDQAQAKWACGSQPEQRSRTIEHLKIAPTQLLWLSRSPRITLTSNRS